MKIAFRMDDITPDMDWKSFEAFEQLFERYGCYPLLGIVPDNLDPKLSVDPARGVLKKIAGAAGKAGLDPFHASPSCVYNKKRQELSGADAHRSLGKSYEEQYRLLESGQKALGSRHRDRSCSWRQGHTLTKMTLRKALGFTHVTDGFGDLPHVRSGMTFLPIAFLRKYAFSDRRGNDDDRHSCQHSTVAG